MGDRYLGTFEAVAEDYREVLRIYESDSLRFEHTFYRNGVLIIKESGKAEVDGYSVFFRDAFTEFIDSDSARPLPQPVKLLNYSLLMLREGEPELDRLLPFAEHRYNLVKIAEQDAPSNGG
jgi:hypothetical protein